MIASSTTWSGSPAPRPARWCMRQGRERAAPVAPPVHHRHLGMGDPGRTPRARGDARSRPRPGKPSRRRAGSPSGSPRCSRTIPPAACRISASTSFAASGRRARSVIRPTSRESERVEWVPLDRVADAIRGGEIVDGMSLVALLHLLAFST